MEEIKNNILKKIEEIKENNENIFVVEFEIEKPKDSNNGDFAIACFKAAKILKQSPVIIANNMQEKLSSDLPQGIKKVEAVNGYLNFYADEVYLAKNILTEILTKKEDCLKQNIGEGKTVCIDYSSPNIAKPFHIGHLRTTIIGACLYKLYKALGYNVVGINHLGDFGTQFGYVIEGYNRWKGEYDLVHEPIKSLVEIYVRISALAKEDESIVQKARENFARLEAGDLEITALWQNFRDLSLKEYKRIYDRLDIHFDSYNGEAFYNDKMSEIVEILEEKNVLKLSDGAKVVEVPGEEVPCMILKSNCSTTYATRDLAAALYRAREYDFTKALYVTGAEQALHFKQVFSTARYIIGDRANGLIHIPFGMVLGPGGKKMSTRRGASTTIEGVIDEAVEVAKNVLTEKGKLDNVDEISELIGKGAVIFNDLKTSRIKDEVFDLNEMLKFEGETGPYVQYMYVRTNSILEKAGIYQNNNVCMNFDAFDYSKFDFTSIKEDSQIALIKLLCKKNEVLQEAEKLNEPSIIARYVLNIASTFSKFYAECSVLSEREEIKNLRLCIVLAVHYVIKELLNILGIKCPEKM